jgi:hypothetical protein
MVVRTMNISQEKQVEVMLELIDGYQPISKTELWDIVLKIGTVFVGFRKKRQFLDVLIDLEDLGEIVAIRVRPSFPSIDRPIEQRYYTTQKGMQHIRSMRIAKILEGK